MNGPEDAVGFVTETRADGTHLRTRLDRLNDGRVMCCLCFEFVTRDRLNPVQGDPGGAVEDVCITCRASEKLMVVYRDNFAGSEPLHDRLKAFRGRRTFRVLVTGSRSWAHPDVVETALDLLYAAAQVKSRRMIVRQGGCPSGPDRTAGQWARARIAEFAEDAPIQQVVDDEWAADWDNCVTGCPRGHRKPKRGGMGLHPGSRSDYCPTAGHRRNQDMVDGGADVCLAFIANASAGATHCAEAAEAAGIVTIRWEVAGEELHWPLPGWGHLVPV